MNVEPQSVPLRVVIVDDNRQFLAAAGNLLHQEGVDVVGTATTSAEAVPLAAEHRPDVILVDVDLGEESGFDLARVFATTSDASVVLISAYPESDLADLIALSSALGFVSKSELSASAITSLLADKRR
jgi:DNA-binding NarL/FixJ family response regulator